MEEGKSRRLQKIRNTAALGLLEQMDYSDCCTEIVRLAQAELDEPSRAAHGGRDRRQRGGKDRSQGSAEG